jgi:hypothetical protein
MEEDKIARGDHISYYGDLNGKLLGENLGSYLVDETFNEILKRNNDVILLNQQKIIKNMEKSFELMMTSFDKFVERKIKKIMRGKDDPEPIVKKRRGPKPKQAKDNVDEKKIRECGSKA